MVPPPSTIGAPPTAFYVSANPVISRSYVYLLPIRNLKTMNMLIFVERAAATVKTMKSRLQEWYKGRRPYISDIGAMTATLASAQLKAFTNVLKGPKLKPRT